MTITRLCLRKWWYHTQKWIFRPLGGDFPYWYPKPLGFSVGWPTPICTGLPMKTCLSKTQAVFQLTIVHQLFSGGCEFEKGLLVRPMYLWAPFFPGTHTKLRCRDLTSMGVDGRGPTYPTQASNSRCRLPCCEAIWAIKKGIIVWLSAHVWLFFFEIRSLKDVLVLV